MLFIFRLAMMLRQFQSIGGQRLREKQNAFQVYLCIWGNFKGRNSRHLTTSSRHFTLCLA